MSLFYQIVMLTLRKRMRQCPKCGHGQVAPMGKEDQRIKCTHCGAAIPPKRR